MRPNLRGRLDEGVMNEDRLLDGVVKTYGHATERMQKGATAAMELVLSS